MHLTAAGNPAQARDIVTHHFQSLRYAVRGVEIHAAAYEFRQLQRWRDEVAALIPLAYGDFTFAASPRTNRVRLGFETEAAAAGARALVANSTVPSESVDIAIVGPIMPAAAHSVSRLARSAQDSSLTDRFYPAHGGISVGSTGTDCTLGFNVLQGQVMRFVTASHCSGDDFALDAFPAYQPAGSGVQMGTEYRDPPPTPAASCPLFQGQAVPCRYTDATLYTWNNQSSTQAEYGWIVKAFDNTPTFHGGDRYRIIGAQTAYYANDPLVQIGVATGRTTGAILDPCVSIRVTYASGLTLHLRCQIETNIPADNRDSGAPVFRVIDDPLYPDYYAYIAGISVARNADRTRAWVTPFTGIENELASGPGTLGLVGLDPIF